MFYSLGHINVRRHAMFFSFNYLTSHVKFTEISLVTFKTNSLMFSLFGLTDISRHFFKLKLLMILSLVKGEAVAVSGTCFRKKDLISLTRPHHFLNGSFPGEDKTWTRGPWTPTFDWVHGPLSWTGSMDPLSRTGSMDSFF